MHNNIFAMHCHKPESSVCASWHNQIGHTNTQTDGGWESLRNLHMITKHSSTHLHSKQHPNADNCSSDITLTLTHTRTHARTLTEGAGVLYELSWAKTSTCQMSPVISSRLIFALRFCTCRSTGCCCRCWWDVLRPQTQTHSFPSSPILICDMDTHTHIGTRWMRLANLWHMMEWVMPWRWMFDPAESGSQTVIREQSGLQPHCYYHAG